MDKLGFTFYPKDWWTSETYFSLSPIQRYYYLESLFIMYSNNGYMKTQKTQLENRMRTQISDEDFELVTTGFILEDNKYTSPTVNKRLRKTLANRKNGVKGGRPKKIDEKPKEPNLETQNNPPLEREREREREVNIESIDGWILKVKDEKMFLEGLYMTYKLRQNTLGKIALVFKEHLKMFPEPHKDFIEFKNHFKSWIGFKIKKGELGEYLKHQKGEL